MRRFLRRLGFDVVRYPSRAHSPLAEFIRKFRIASVIDVGANVGQYGSRLRQLEGFTGEILSVEPDPVSFAALITRARSDTRWTAVQVALGDQESTATLHVAELSVFSSIRAPSAFGK